MAQDSWGGSWGSSWLLTWTRGGSAPVVNNNWLGGPTDYAVRKKHLEELDKIEEKIRLRQKAAFKALTEFEVPQEIQVPEIRKIDEKYLRSLNRKKEQNIQALINEINLIRENLLAQQIYKDLAAREMDDETAFLLMLN
jgi:hypothetical protein